MMPHRSCLLSTCCLLLLQLALAIRIHEVPKDLAPSTTVNTPAYRVSRPAPKQPAQRVPAHLQDIRPGFVDDDAGDVIRIIEPPQHFQQLKRMRQRQSHASVQAQPHSQKAIVWEQPRKLSSNRATKPKISLKMPSNGDLLTQETQQTSHNLNNLQLPMEILASVRKTERLLKRQRQKLPLMRQRHIQRQTHTLITQKSMEKERSQRGQQHRLRATVNQEQEYKRSKRVKRATAAAAAATPTDATRYDVANGLKLVAHIGELLKNATKYLPDELAAQTGQQPIASKLQRICDNSTSCDVRQRRRQRQRLIRQQAVEKKTAVRRRNFRFESITTTTTAAAAAAATTAATTTSATPLASRLINSRKANNHNQSRLQQVIPSSRSSNDDSVLYADIMSNIRNLWQDQEPQFVANRTADIGALNVYLNQLDEIAKKLPTALPITGLEHQELSRETVTPTRTPPPSYYLFNNDRTDEQLLPLPDMPEGNETVATLALELE